MGWYGRGVRSFPCIVGGGGRENPPIPFNLNTTWIEDEGFKQLVSDKWIPFDDNIRESTSYRFLQNLKNIKFDSIIWALERRKAQQAILINIKKTLECFYENNLEALRSLE